MSKIEEVFQHLQATKKKQGDLKKIYRDALSNTRDYQRINDEIKLLRQKKKEIEIKISQELSSEMDKIERMTLDINEDKEILADLVISKLSKGEIVKIKDDYNRIYEPILSVKFQKTEEQE